MPVQLRLPPLGQRREVARVCPAGSVQLAFGRQALCGVLAHRLQHAERRVVVLLLLILVVRRVCGLLGPASSALLPAEVGGAHGQDQALLGEREQLVQRPSAIVSPVSPRSSSPSRRAGRAGSGRVAARAAASSSARGRPSSSATSRATAGA
ncbi:MAG: hypothetical protein ACXVDF_22105, partial [Ktedonobacterales bacterium]